MIKDLLVNGEGVTQSSNTACHLLVPVDNTLFSLLVIQRCSTELYIYSIFLRQAGNLEDSKRSEKNLYHNLYVSPSPCRWVFSVLVKKQISLNLG